MGSKSDDGGDYESLATLVAVAIAAFAKHRDTPPLLLAFVEDEDSRRLRHVVDARDDGSEGEDNTPRVKRTRRVFPRPTYKASFACALRCSGAANPCEYVRGRAIAVVDYFSRELY